MALAFLRTGSFPHQMYVAQCQCPDGKEEPVLNYAKHKVAPPRCSACKRSYVLDIDLMQRLQKENK